MNNPKQVYQLIGTLAEVLEWILLNSNGDNSIELDKINKVFSELEGTGYYVRYGDKK
jgi:hypothetical protein